MPGTVLSSLHRLSHESFSILREWCNYYLHSIDDEIEFREIKSQAKAEST